MAANPLASRTYLDKFVVQQSLQLLERSPESAEHHYKRAIGAVLRYFFHYDRFGVLEEGPRYDENDEESRAEVAVVQFITPPGGSTHTYDYCLVEIKKADMPWMAARYHLSRHCAGTENVSRLVYGIVQVGLHIQFYFADRGVLTALSDALHLRNDVARITERMEYMKRHPFPLV